MADVALVNGEDGNQTGLIEAASGQCKTMADGTLRIVFDVEPRYAAAAFALFSAPGTPAVLGRLQAPEVAPETAAVESSLPAKAQVKRERMGPLCEWAVMRCREEQFQTWAIWRMKSLPNCQSREDHARSVVVELCGVKSRKELDTDATAAHFLHERVRRPYMAWIESQQETTA